MRVSQRAIDIQESPIRKLSALAGEVKRKGISIYHLNIGQPDIHTPEIFRRRIVDYSEKVLSYGPSDGPEPFYTNYNGYASLCGLKLAPVTTLAEKGFHLPPIHEIEAKITPKTRAI